MLIKGRKITEGWIFLYIVWYTIKLSKNHNCVHLTQMPPLLATVLHGDCYLDPFQTFLKEIYFFIRTLLSLKKILSLKSYSNLLSIVKLRKNILGLNRRQTNCRSIYINDVASVQDKASWICKCHKTVRNFKT